MESYGILALPEELQAHLQPQTRSAAFQGGRTLGAIAQGGGPVLGGGINTTTATTPRSAWLDMFVRRTK